MGNATERLVELASRHDEALVPARRVYAGPGFVAEHVEISQEREIEFRWSGASHYIALHDMMMIDGETRLDAQTVQQKDIRNRLTFVPSGCDISGWSRFGRKTNSFVAVSIDPDVMNEGGAGKSSTSYKPMLYFADDALRTTLQKLDRVLKQPGPLDTEYCDMLAATCALEIHRAQRQQFTADAPPRQLTPSDANLIKEYVWSHLDKPILLSDLATLVKVSRFHFLRMFRETSGSTPYQYVLNCRVDRAQMLLTSTELSISEVASAVGFGTPQQFSTAFRKITGVSPSRFRRR